MNSAQMMVPKRFGMLRVIGILLKVLAWLSLVMGVVGAVTGLLAGGAVTDLLSTNGIASLGGGEAIILALGGLLTGLISFLALYAAGEGIFLQLAVEENTITPALLMKMDQEAGAETGYTVVN